MVKLTQSQYIFAPPKARYQPVSLTSVTRARQGGAFNFPAWWRDRQRGVSGTSTRAPRDYFNRRETMKTVWGTINVFTVLGIVYLLGVTVVRLILQ
jgi:hypothetical protein